MRFICLIPTSPCSFQCPLQWQELLLLLWELPCIFTLIFYSSAEHNPSSFPYLHGWVEARVKEGFVFNDVADSWHDGLVEENVTEHPVSLALHGLLGAGETELGGAHVQTLHGPDPLLAVFSQPASTQENLENIWPLLFWFLRYEIRRHRLNFRAVQINACLATQAYFKTLQVIIRTNAEQKDNICQAVIASVFRHGLM